MADGSILIAPAKTKKPKKKIARVADLFCGAGGSSTGARIALERLGYDMKLLCVNHWDTAIATHQKNHPGATHYCQDVSTVRPHIVVKGGRLDLLMASPTCTFHSRARGGKPISDQQRMDPWQVITWLTELRVQRLIIENVPEFMRWGPVNTRTMRPIKRREGEYFIRWMETITNIGHKADFKVLNCADYGDVTTRERFFLMSRSDGKRLAWPDPTHAKLPAADMFRGALKPWRAAREIIDWEIKGRSIFDRKKPLSPNTLARILHGIIKFGWPQPFIVVLRNHMAAQGIDAPLPTITSGGTHIALCQPFVLSTAHGIDQSERDPHSRRSKSIDEPLGTVHAGGGNFGVVEPFIISGQAGGAPRSVDEPTPGMTGKNNGPVLIAPYYGGGSGKTCSSAEDPLPSVTTKGRFGIIMPVTHSRDSSNRARDVTSPLPTITGANRGEMGFVTAQFGEREGQTPRVRSIAEPLPTICAQGHTDLVVPGRDFDILFRMFETHELAAAHSFIDDDLAYEFSGNKTEIIKQIGNSVPVQTASALVRAIMAD